MKKRVAELLNDLDFKLVDASTNLLEFFSMKDELEIQNIRKEVFLCASILKIYVSPKLDVVIDKRKSHYTCRTPSSKFSLMRRKPLRMQNSWMILRR